ncbi:MAG: hypothetical protein HYS17_09245 [Micavibrio aeruginosavorus]|uniref:Uncharacterized protein n=1 Tax=Micavibrio aeruginosavorus TaxID=349221 RepID=A0A7T5R1A8_9BACT|nr:MAG: hypothetical protein HYS17_09245 [Micavibrio aeruginosavorus]
MIGLIGTKRLVMLAVLLCLNGAMGAGAYLYLIPQNGKLDQELRQLKSNVSTKRAESDRFRQEFDEIQREKGKFQSLEAQGFLSDQNRASIQKRIDVIQRYSRVSRAAYNIDRSMAEDVEVAREANRVVVKSPVKFEIDAIDDMDVFSFLYLLENAFIGHTAITSFELERVLDLNDVTMRQIGSGMDTVLVKSSVQLDWKTLMNRDDAALFGVAIAEPTGD